MNKRKEGLRPLLFSFFLPRCGKSDIAVHRVDSKSGEAALPTDTVEPNPVAVPNKGENNKKVRIKMTMPTLAGHLALRLLSSFPCPLSPVTY